MARTARTAAPDQLAAAAPATAYEYDAIDVRISDVATRLDALERQLGDLVSAHRTHAGHLRHIDRTADAIANAARAAVQAARDAARDQRLAAERERAGDRVRVRAVREIDAWAGPRSERLRLSPTNVRADACRVIDRATFAAMLERSDEVRAALDGGALAVEDLAPDEVAAIEVAR